MSGLFSKNQGEGDVGEPMQDLTPEELEVQEEVQENYTYSPPSLLEVPEEVRRRFKNAGYILRWIRYSLDGEEDYRNISQRMMEGYEFVKIEEVPELSHTTRLQDKGIHKSLVTNGDVALAKIKVEKAEARQEYYQRQAQALEGAINRELQKHNTRTMPIYDTSRSETKSGKNAEFAP